MQAGGPILKLEREIFTFFDSENTKFPLISHFI